MSGSQWLTRPDDVVAHLFYAAAEIGEARVETGGQTREGSISFPSPETGTFSFFSNSEGEKPKDGAVVRVRYQQDSSEFAFLTELVEIPTPKRWRLAFPRTIERNEQRLIARHQVHQFGGFRVRLDTGDGGTLAVPVHDLSTGGLSFVFDPQEHALVTGKALAGNLVMPSGMSIPLLIEVRHLRSAPDDPGRQLAGCRFVGLTATDHASLARTLAEWRKKFR